MISHKPHVSNHLYDGTPTTLRLKSVLEAQVIERENFEPDHLCSEMQLGIEVGYRNYPTSQGGILPEAFFSASMRNFTYRDRNALYLSLRTYSIE